MKNLYFIFIALICFACKEQAINIAVLDEEEDTMMLLGPANEEGLQQAPFNSWYTTTYADYKVNDSLIALIKPELKDVSIKLFMGTWCEDSQRETPGIYKILDASNFNLDNLQLTAVDRDKVTPQKLEENLNITNVPTLIFFKDGKEMNRIVEYPIESLEQDILHILTNQPYKNAYFEEE